MEGPFFLLSKIVEEITLLTYSEQMGGGGQCEFSVAAELRLAPRLEVRLAVAYVRTRGRGLTTNRFIYKPGLST